MFGKTKKMLLKELKEIKNQLRKVNARLNYIEGDKNLGDTDMELPKITQNPTEKSRIGVSSSLFKYYENNLDKIDVIIKAGKNNKYDTLGRGLRDYQLSTLATLLRKGYSKEKIAKITGLKKASVDKYLSLGTQIGYFIATRGKFGNKKTYRPNMQYFDVVNQ